MQVTEVKVEDKGKATLYHAQSIGALSAFVSENRAKMAHLNGGSGSNDKFCGCSPDVALARLATGNEKLVAQSDAMMEKMEGKIDPLNHAFATMRAVTGGVANVPAYLSGSPMNMVSRRRMEAQHGPVAIFVDVTVSAGVDGPTIARRGAATLALVRALQATRPVTLIVTMGMRQKGVDMISLTEIDTAPLDLARAAWVLGSQEYLRRIGFALSDHACDNAGSGGNNIRWAFQDHSWQLESLPGWAADRAGASDYVAVPGVFVGTTFNSDDNAADWVVEMVEKLSPERD